MSTSESMMPACPSSEAHEVCAVIVAFHPDDGLSTRLQTLAAQVGAMVVVDNTPAAVRGRSIDLPPTLAGLAMLLENADNLGIASALNQGLAQARTWGCRWLLTLDQDTVVYSDMIDSLLAVARVCGQDVVVIGANHLDERNGRTAVAAQGRDTWQERKTVITSGSLLRMSATEVIGGFRDDYFIDQVDHEYCLRVRARGGRVVITRKVAMKHSVGEEGGVRLPWLGVLPRHSALRKYYIARNSITTVACHWRQEPQWCVRRMLRLFGGAILMVLLESPRSLKLKSFLLGVGDGLRGRMGPCPHDALTKQ